jgi:hypothetical protein
MDSDLAPVMIPLGAVTVMVTIAYLLIKFCKWVAITAAVIFHPKRLVRRAR